jgi:hypothetical protein
MIELHRLHNDPASDEIEERLQAMVVAHRVFRYPEDPAGSSEKPPDRSSVESTGAPPAPLPFLRESDKIISGREDTARYLDELERFMRVQHTYSADACYIDPETGEIC